MKIFIWNIFLKLPVSSQIDRTSSGGNNRLVFVPIENKCLWHEYSLIYSQPYFSLFFFYGGYKMLIDIIHWRKYKADYISITINQHKTFQVIEKKEEKKKLVL